MYLAVGLVCLFLATGARAETPDGAYSVDLGDGGNLAFPNGADEICEELDGTEGCITSDVATDANGAVNGSGTVVVTDPQGSLDLVYEIGGQIGGTVAKPTAKLVLALDGTGEVGGLEIDVSGEGKVGCKLDPTDSSRLLCKAKVRMCGEAFGERFCDRTTFPIALPLERVPLTVALDLDTDARGAVTGTAQVLVDGAPAFGYTAKGKYKETTDLVNLKLTGSDPADKTKLALKGAELEFGYAMTGEAKFRVAGQKGQSTVVAPPTFASFGASRPGSR
jgi:hypothetical protein